LVQMRLTLARLRYTNSKTADRAETSDRSIHRRLAI
jgi:hypothetical protein